MAVALLCAAGAWAQTWTGNAVAAGTFYLYNVGADKFLNVGDPNAGWGTNAYLTTTSEFDVTLARISDGVYTIETQISNGENEHYLNSSTWCDGTATNWTFRAVDGETNVYQIIFNGQYIMANATLDDVEMVGDPAGRTTSTYWKLVTKADRIAALANATAENPINATFLLSGANFGRNDQRVAASWTMEASNKNLSGGNNTNNCAESYHSTFYLSQTSALTVPDGVYGLTAQGFYRQDGSDATNLPYFFIQYPNSSQKTFPVKSGSEGNMSDASSSFTAGSYTVDELKVIVSGGKLTVGARNEANTALWCIFDNFVLKYYGATDASFTVSKATLKSAVDAATAYAATITGVPAAVKSNLQSVVSAKNTDYSTIAEYAAATKAVDDALGTAKEQVSSLSALYAKYYAIRPYVIALDDDATIFTGSATVDVAAADAAIEAATTVDSEKVAIATLKDAASTFLNSVAVNSGKYFDITRIYLENTDFESSNIDGWTCTFVKGETATNIGFQNNNKYKDEDENVKISNFIEAWRSGNTALGDGQLYQIVSGLPEGKYVLEADAIAVNQGNASAETTGALLYITASGVDYTAALSTGNGVSKHFDTEFLSPGDVDVTFGLKTVSTTANWICADNFVVKFYGIDLSPYAPLLATAVSNTRTEAELSDLPTAVKSALTALASEKESAEYTKSKQYTDAINALNDAIANAEAIRVVYNRFMDVKTNVLALKSQTTKFTDREGDSSFSTLDSDVAAAEVSLNAATTIESVNAAITELRTAGSTFAGNISLIKGQYLDLTDAMLYNASMRNSGDLTLWTIATNTNPSYPKYANNCSEFYQANFDFYQIAPELPSGNYNIEVSAFHRAGTYNTYLYANSETVQVLPISNGENNTAQAEASFNAGLYLNSIKITLDEPTDVRIGFKNEDTATDKWTIFRDFKIKFFGDDALAVYREEYENALEAATDALSDATYTNVAGTDRSNLSTAVTTTYPTSVVETEESQEKFETATSNLTSLTTTFKNGVASWNTYANSRAGVTTAKAEADLLATSIYTGAGITSPNTAAEAASKATTDEPAIRVATADYVATNYIYSLTSKIGDFSTWTPTATVNGNAATAQTLSSEHWSNTTRTYYEQASAGWDSDAWTVQYQKIANNLPAGNYVLKLAARGSAGITGSIASSATANTVGLPTAFNNTRGITTSGDASWSDSDTFRKSAGASTEDNKGAGWQWRFLPFTVSEAGDVTLTISAAAAQKYQWVSLADAELLSDEDKTTKTTLDEASNMADEISDNDGELATVTWKRTIKAGYNTVVVPFDLTAVQVQSIFGAGSVVYGYSENSADVNSADLTFTTISSGAITANVPVLVKATVASTQKVIEGVSIEAPTSAVAVTGTNFDYVGVYDNTTFANGDYFMATQGGIQKIFESDGTDSAKPFRAYFQKKTVAPVKANLIIDGLTTNISEINSHVAEESIIYNLAGQRMSKAQRGVNIVNGKKVIIK